MTMSEHTLTDAELSAYLDEMLPATRAAEIETLLRQHAQLRERVVALVRQRDAGGHTVGEIWRRHRLSCLSRSQLGQFILGVTSPDMEQYIRFHVDDIGCRICQANLEDLRIAHDEQERSQTRQRRYFESSAGVLRRLTDDESS